MSPEVVVLIPAFEPAHHLPEIVGDLVDAGLTQVVVVDDGSGPSFAQVFRAAGDRGAVVLRHPENQGKGAALRTALTHVLDHHPGVPGVVTADADGQHSATDVARVARELRGHDQGARVCVLGERDFDLPNIPWRSRVGNKVTTALLRLLYRRHLPDTQTGLRGLSLPLLPELIDVPGDRFDHEMRALTHLLSTRADIVRVPIDTVYEEGVNATSHFRPVRDSAIIYGAMLRQLLGFVVTSGLGFVVDVAVFVLVMDLVFDGRPTLQTVGISTVAARCVSAAVNYAANRLLVFGSRSRVTVSVGRYATLACGLIATSWLLTSALSWLLGDHVVWAKIVVDCCLFAVSYLVQRHWVFAGTRHEARDREGDRVPARR